MIKKILGVFFFIFFLQYFLYAEYEMDFMNIPVDAYSAGCAGYMGNSLFSDNVSSLYYINTNRINFSHAFLFSQNNSIDGFAIVLPISNISIYMNFVYYLVKDIPIYSEDFDSLQPSLSDSFFNVYGTIYSFGVSYYKNINNKLIVSGGIKAKYVYEDLFVTQGTFSSLIPSFSSLLLINSGMIKGFSFDILFDNLIKTTVLWTTPDTIKEEEIKRDTKIGGNILWNINKFNLILNTYVSYSKNYGLYFGLVSRYKNDISVFSGYSNRGWGCGISIFMWNIGVSYGYMLVDAGNTHRLTVEIKW